MRQWHGLALGNVFSLKKIGTQQEPATYKMKCGQEITNIENVACEKDLGVIIDQALNFSEQS